MKVYPEYKNSKVEWLGDIPSHWDVQRVKFLSKTNPEYGLNISSEAYTEGGVRFLRTTDIDDKGALITKGVYLSPEDVEEYYLLKEGDFLVSRSGTVGRAYVHQDNRSPFSFAGYLVRFRFDNAIIAKYLFWFTKSLSFLEWINLNRIESTISNVNGQKYANLSFAIPKREDEIKQVVDFLDRKTTQIDTLIEEKLRQIVLLQEHRTAIINHAVIRGLNPNAPMKDSGIEWLGDIPLHWDVKRVKFLSKTNPEYGLNIGSEAYTDGGVRFLRTTDIDDNGELASDGVYLSNENVDEDYLLREGDFLISRSGTIGRAYVHQDNRSPFSFAGYLVRFRFDNPTIARYLFWFTKSLSFLEWINLNRIESTISNVNGQKYANLSFAIPRWEDEIKLIVDFLDANTAQINELIERMKNQISYYQEYRTALISAAVTGKIDVRSEGS